jgi:hypothetical protein
MLSSSSRFSSLENTSLSVNWLNGLAHAQCYSGGNVLVSNMGRNAGSPDWGLLSSCSVHAVRPRLSLLWERRAITHELNQIAQTVRVKILSAVSAQTPGTEDICIVP